ncbi:MAG TPA: choice-of-anchor Q domain-containing protein [Tahibacter sp.]|uniref:choice-of-anchor Q domain-containing protein n=1 Tax=Tahibacter sp. TaxID=2056211 RepID=UPI002BA21823|nr:choice-of-anchor Q domain-containing protein [Tahibacter sp.]HSX58950.1 choice-of-anchor Q domain-containing protein [Tahibacter sp.]
MKHAWILLLSAASAAPLHAQNPIWVTSGASSGSGTLRAAILSLNPSTSALQEIRFAIPTTPSNPIAEVVLAEPLPPINGTNVLINGDRGADYVVVDGNGRQIFTVEENATTTALEIRDLTLRGGAVVNNGGCVRIRRAATATTLRRIVADQCKAYLSVTTNPVVRGGAVYTKGALTIEDSRFTGNRILSMSANEASSDASGGALFAEGSQPVTIARSLFRDNRIYLGNQLPSFCRSGSGGAIGLALTNALAQIADTSFVDNATACRNPTVTYDIDGTGDGGAIAVYGQGGETRLDANYFHGNIGSRGGAVGFLQPLGMLATLTNNTFHENTSNQAGGGAALINCCSLAMTNNTFSGNVARSPGLANQLQASSNVLALYNNIFNGANTNRDCIVSTAQQNSGHNLYANDACWTSGDGTSQIVGAMPWLQAPRMTGGYVPTMMYTNGSLPVDRGDDAHCAARDARGVPRPLDGDIDGTSHCDIGAVEHSFIDVIFRSGFQG